MVEAGDGLILERAVKGGGGEVGLVGGGDHGDEDEGGGEERLHPRHSKRGPQLRRHRRGEGAAGGVGALLETHPEEAASEEDAKHADHRGGAERGERLEHAEGEQSRRAHQDRRVPRRERTRGPGGHRY